MPNGHRAVAQPMKKAPIEEQPLQGRTEGLRIPRAHQHPGRWLVSGNVQARRLPAWCSRRDALILDEIRMH